MMLAAGAEGRTLHWRALDVEARLDREGELHVVERHRMLFDGAWNGGERVFRLEPGQELQLLSISAVDGGGTLHPLSRAGGSVGLHEYSWDGRQLRWRARRVSDPPFRNQELTYVLEYRMRNVVERKGGEFLLSHDFAFAGRPGRIESFTLRFDLDPVWEAAPGFAPTIERENIPPGQSLTVNAPLRWSGEGAPRFLGGAPRLRLPPVSIVEEELPAAALFLLLMTGIGWSFIRRESRSGRYEPRPAPTRAWLEENVLVHRAEVVGAAWDGETGQAEVAALLAIMTGEGKIATEMNNGPRMRLLVPRATLSDYERAFVDRLFIAGDEIDQATLRRHYAPTGFDPAAAIRGHLGAAVRRVTGHSRSGIPYAFGCSALLLALIGFPLLLALSGDETGLVLSGCIFVSLAVMLGLTIHYDSAPSARRAALLTLPPLLAGIVAVLARTTLAATIAALTLLVVLFWLTQIVGAWSGTPQELRNLQSLRAAREFLRRRLELHDPAIEERWVPYILAFGLGPYLDAWSVAVQRVAGPARDDGWEPSRYGRSSSQASPSFFVPGGGRFGGAGATGGWARSINEFAASVPPPAPPPSESGGGSSGGWSSSSSSSSSGSSSSGGGSGGGW